MRNVNLSNVSGQVVGLTGWDDSTNTIWLLPGGVVDFQPIGLSWAISGTNGVSDAYSVAWLASGSRVVVVASSSPSGVALDMYDGPDLVGWFWVGVIAAFAPMTTLLSVRYFRRMGAMAVET
jgi:hypothetical protein